MQFTGTWVTSISFYKSLVYIRPTAVVFVMLKNRLATQLSCLDYTFTYTVQLTEVQAIKGVPVPVFDHWNHDMQYKTCAC